MPLVRRIPLLLCWTLLAGMFGCTQESGEADASEPVHTAQPAPGPRPAKAPQKNMVAVLGTIHGKHRTSETYSLAMLRGIISSYSPDLVLVEIPPDRYRIAFDEFARTDSITEPRVSRFPEYVDVLFPMTKAYDFEIVPTAAWSKPMADARRARLDSISQDPARKADWAEYKAGEAAADAAIAALGDPEDPLVIQSDAYDAAVELWAGPYQQLFGKELGLGGWNNINRAHYQRIENELVGRAGAGLRILITYGAYHKGWFLRQLRKRADISIVDMTPFIDAASESLQ